MTRSRFYQSGLSLIELMIAIGLGLLLVAGATQIFMTNTQAFRLQSGISSAQESGRLGLEMLLTDLRRAGVDDPASTLASATRSFGVAGRDGAATVLAMPGLLSNSDEITVSYRVPPEVATMSDCEGHAAVSQQVIVNRYFVALDSNPSLPALFCEGRVDGLPVIASGGVALIRGVESFQVNYGLAAGFGSTAAKGNGFTSPARYIAGTGASGLTDRNASGTITAADAVLVASIRVALLVRSETGIQGVRAPTGDIVSLDQTIPVATLATATANGSFPVHRSFVGTAALRNLAYGYF